jgi:hypothetical protein
MYIWIDINMCMHICPCIYKDICISIYWRTWKCLIFLCMWFYYTYSSFNIYNVYSETFDSESGHIYIYIYIYVFIYKYVYTYIYIYIYIFMYSGSGHICVLEMKHGTDTGGRARCWGDEEDDGKTLPPQDVTFIQLASGISFTCGITLEQTVLCWGSVRNGGRVPGLFTQITASELYACGVRTDGSLLCWGEDMYTVHVFMYNPLPYICIYTYIYKHMYAY